MLEDERETSGIKLLLVVRDDREGESDDDDVDDIDIDIFDGIESGVEGRLSLICLCRRRF